MILILVALLTVGTQVKGVLSTVDKVVLIDNELMTVAKANGRNDPVDLKGVEK